MLYFSPAAAWVVSTVRIMRSQVRTSQAQGGGGGKQKGISKSGKSVSIQKLAEIFLRLQDVEKANNINLVTAAHFIPQVAEALEIAGKRGLHIPVIYNSSGYEKVSSLRMLDGLVDVYLPDLKYLTPELAALYSHAKDYPDRAKEAIAEMVRQVGEPRFGPEQGNEEKTADQKRCDRTQSASSGAR